MKNRKQLRELAFAVVFLLLTSFLLNLIANALRPGRVDYGSTWRAYLGEPKNSIDVLYLGSSFAYCDYNPSLIYESSGLTGFVTGGSEQTLSLTYYYLKEALKTQSPSAVVLEGSALFFKGAYQNYTQINVGYMPFGVNKLQAIFQASEPELRLGLLFDPYFYHTRWKDIRPADLKRAVTPVRADHYKGYTAIAGVVPTADLSPHVGGQDVQGENYAANFAWLEKIVKLCADQSIQLIVAFNPTYGRCTPEDYEKVTGDILAAGPGVQVYNWSDAFEEIGLDGQRHFYDGIHLNQEGSAIFSAWLGQFLTREVGLTPRPQSDRNTAAWVDSAAQWRAYLAQ